MAEAGVLDGRPVVLLFYRYFSPRFEATGPTQSLRRLVNALGDRFRFRVVTIADGDEEEMRWGEAFGAERIAVARGPKGIAQQRRLIAETPFDLALHNSFFDPQMTIAVLAMRKLALIPRKPTIVAPRGEMNAGALALKSPRKRAYLAFARATGLLDDIHLQASDETEAAAVRRAIPEAESILLSPNVRVIEPLPEFELRKAGEPLRIAFLSRVDPMKNLDLALTMLSRTTAPVRFDIIGPTFNPQYWAKCKALIEAMPASVPVRYLGPVAADQVVPTLAGYDLMLLPTAGENYGHAIVDSMLAGTPVLVSDRTPWRGLAERRAGADLPLGEDSAWLGWIERFALMNETELMAWRSGARSFVEAALRAEAHGDAIARSFEAALAKGA